MPIYGYRCPSCETEFEVLQRMTDQARAECPRCGAAARRLFYPAGIVFKGSGFHKTDYRPAPKPEDGRASESTHGPASGAAASSGSTAKGASDGSSSNGSSRTAAAKQSRST